MTTLVISFPWGLYHATPWARNVNEGAVDWPPSPWRVLRALYATWKTRASHLDDTTVHGLLEDLSAPPIYTVPAYVESHTRHYMPDASHRIGISGSTDKVIDAFVVTERNASIAITWDVELDVRRRAALEELAGLLPYLGRAESVCVARVAGEDESLEEIDGARRCAPLDEGAAVEAPVRLLVPTRPLDVDALTVRTTTVRKSGRLDPPGTTWVDYEAPTAAVPLARPRHRRRVRPTALRWALATNAPPSRHAAVAVADALRYASMGRYGSLFDGATSPVLGGKDENGRPLRDHRHAHYLALDLDGDRRLDTAVLWAPGGLTEQDTTAVATLLELRGRSFVKDLRPCRLGLEAVGEIASVAPEIVGPSTTWTSWTPFAPTRHGRRSTEWTQHVAAAVHRECAFRGLPGPRAVQVLRGGWLDFRRHRLRERLEDARRAIGVQIEFGAPVEGPIALGALSHFGLGLFLPNT